MPYQTERTVHVIIHVHDTISTDGQKYNPLKLIIIHLTLSAKPLTNEQW